MLLETQLSVHFNVEIRLSTRYYLSHVLFEIIRWTSISERNCLICGVLTMVLKSDLVIERAGTFANEKIWKFLISQQSSTNLVNCEPIKTGPKIPHLLLLSSRLFRAGEVFDICSSAAPGWSVALWETSLWIVWGWTLEHAFSEHNKRNDVVATSRAPYGTTFKQYVAPAMEARTRTLKATFLGMTRGSFASLTLCTQVKTGELGTVFFFFFCNAWNNCVVHEIKAAHQCSQIVSAQDISDVFFCVSICSCVCVPSSVDTFDRTPFTVRDLAFSPCIVQVLICFHFIVWRIRLCWYPNIVKAFSKNSVLFLLYWSVSEHLIWSLMEYHYRTYIFQDVAFCLHSCLSTGIRKKRYLFLMSNLQMDVTYSQTFCQRTLFVNQRSSHQLLSSNVCRDRRVAICYDEEVWSHGRHFILSDLDSIFETQGRVRNGTERARDDFHSRRWVLLMVRSMSRACFSLDIVYHSIHVEWKRFSGP